MITRYIESPLATADGEGIETMVCNDEKGDEEDVIVEVMVLLTKV